MKVVIDIEEGRYNWIMSHASKHPYDYADASDLFFRTAVERGIVLPKGHGDLVDISKLYDQKIEQWNPFVEFLGEEYVSTGAIETYAKVIIPADKGED